MEQYSEIKLNKDALFEDAEFELTYNGKLANDAKKLYIRYGTNGWDNVNEVMMYKTPEGYKANINIPTGTENFNFCFRDGEDNWDNNNEANFTYDVLPMSLSLKNENENNIKEDFFSNDFLLAYNLNKEINFDNTEKEINRFDEKDNNESLDDGRTKTVGLSDEDLEKITFSDTEKRLNIENNAKEITLKQFEVDNKINDVLENKFANLFQEINVNDFGSPTYIPENNLVNENINLNNTTDSNYTKVDFVDDKKLDNLCKNMDADLLLSPVYIPEEDKSNFEAARNLENIDINISGGNNANYVRPTLIDTKQIKEYENNQNKENRELKIENINEIKENFQNITRKTKAPKKYTSNIAYVALYKQARQEALMEILEEAGNLEVEKEEKHLRFYSKQNIMNLMRMESNKKSLDINENPTIEDRFALVARYGEIDEYGTSIIGTIRRYIAAIFSSLKKLFKTIAEDFAEDNNI